MLAKLVRAAALLYIAVTAVFLGFLGLTWAFFPEDHMARLGVEVTSLPAINTLKSIMGTALLGVSLACVLFLRDRKAWSNTLLLLVGVMLIVRITSLLIDGFHLRMGIYAVLELLIIAAVIGAVRLEDRLDSVRPQSTQRDGAR